MHSELRNVDPRSLALSRFPVGRWFLLLCEGSEHAGKHLGSPKDSDGGRLPREGVTAEETQVRSLILTAQRLIPLSVWWSLELPTGRMGGVEEGSAHLTLKWMMRSLERMEVLVREIW